MTNRILVVLFALFLPQMASGEVKNDKGRFADSTCPSYKEFLFGNTPDPTSGCSKAESFVISHATEPDWSFFDQYEDIPPEQSVVMYLLRSHAAAEVASPELSYEEFDLADRLAFSTFNKLSDFERAIFYSALLSKLKVQAILKMCGKLDLCNHLRAFSSFSNLLGDDFSYLDGLPPERLLRCLLRTDGFNAPIREVIQSHRAKTCFATSGT